MNNFGPPIRARSDPYPGVINRPGRSTPIGFNHTVPYGTAPVFARIPGNKLPGYDHLVPSGQNPTSLTGQTRPRPHISGSVSVGFLSRRTRLDEQELIPPMLVVLTHGQRPSLLVRQDLSGPISPMSPIGPIRRYFT